MIQMDKKYRYRNGGPATILTVNRPTSMSMCVVSMDEKGHLHTHTKAGHFYPGNYTNNDQRDLIEIVPYADFKIDDPVMVRENPTDKWTKRHFAGVSKNGKPTAFINGFSKFTCINEFDLVEWNECRHPTQEELEGKIRVYHLSHKKEK